MRPARRGFPHRVTILHFSIIARLVKCHTTRVRPVRLAFSIDLMLSADILNNFSTRASALSKLSAHSSTRDFREQANYTFSRASLTNVQATMSVSHLKMTIRIRV